MDHKTSAIILAGGKGTRIGGDTPKQYLNIGGYPLIYYSLKAFSDSPVDEIILVCGKGDADYCSSEIVDKYGFNKVRSIVTGGSERYHSVYNGLEAIRRISGEDNGVPCDYVFIHDGARPFVDDDIIMRAYNAAVEYGAAVVALPASDTVKVSDDNGFAAQTLPRSRVWLMQTPQVFDFDEIYDSYSRLAESEAELSDKGVVVTDDAMVLELFSDKKVRFVEGSRRNIKVTTPEDLELVNYYLAREVV